MMADDKSIQKGDVYYNRAGCVITITIKIDGKLEQELFLDYGEIGIQDVRWTGRIEKCQIHRKSEVH